MSNFVDVVLEMTVVEIDQDGLTVEVIEEAGVVEVVEGLSLATNIVAALNAAADPGVDNPFATLADVNSFARIFMMGA